MKLNVIAREMAVRDQPVVVDIGCRNTGREKIAPIATHPMNAPAATITQRYPCAGDFTGEVVMAVPFVSSCMDVSVIARRYASTITSKPPKISRVPSNGMALVRGSTRGSCITIFMPSSRA